MDWAMRVISKSRLRQFWEMVSHDDARGPLVAWYTHVNHRKTQWQSWGNVRDQFATASLVGNCAVFNIGGNKYRLITRILYPSQKVFILKIMTHAEYDNNSWKEDCGCYSPPPKRPIRKDQPAQPKPTKRGKKQ